MNPGKATIIRYKSCLKIKQKKYDKLLKALLSANDLCRSAHAIAEREGKNTNWKAFKARLSKSLKVQHAAIYGEEATNANTKRD